MRIGLPREIKPQEQRVGLTPGGVLALTQAGHQVFVEKDAGLGAGFANEEYEQAGAQLVSQAEAWEKAEMVVKVKEPISPEYQYLREDLTLFTYLHLAADKPLTEALLAAKTRGIAYETVRSGRALPLLLPMSEVAGRLAAQAATQYTLATEGGQGILLGGVPGVAPGRVVVLGGGNVGTHAAKLAVGAGAEVTILEGYGPRVRELADLFGSTARVLNSTPANIEREIKEADVIIGSILVPGAKAPKVVRREHLATMKPGAEGIENPNHLYNLTEKVEWKNIVGGDKIEIQGRSLGGCLDCIRGFIGTKYDNVKNYIQKHKQDGIIWFLECFEMSTADLVRILWQMKNSDYFKNCNGIIFGRPLFIRNDYDIDFNQAVKDAIGDLNIPIICDADIGHVSPQIATVNGAILKIKSEYGRGTVETLLK